MTTKASNILPAVSSAILAIIASSLALHEAVTYSNYSVFALYYLLLIFGSAIAFFAAMWNKQDVSYSTVIFISSYSVATIVTILIGWYFRSWGGEVFTPAIFGSNPDDRKYYEIGLAIMQDWLRNGVISELSAYTHSELLRFKYKGFPYIVAAALYFSDMLGDRSPLTFRLIGAFAAGITTLYTYKLAKLFFSDLVSRRAALFSILIPVWAYYAAVGTRDSLIAALITIITFHFVVLVRKQRQPLTLIINIAALFLSFALLYYLRSATVFAVFLAGGLWLGFEWLRTTRKISFAPIVIVAGLLMLTVQLLFPDAQLEESFNQADRYSAAISTSSSSESLAQRYVFSLPAVVRYPISVVYTLFIPVPPFKSFHLHHIVLGISASVWYFMVPLWLLGMYFARNVRESTVITFMSIILLLAVSYVVPSIRHKTQFLALALIHASYATSILGARTLIVVIGAFVFYSLLGALYLALKMY